MKNTIGIRREDLSKKGEKRVAVTPKWAAELTKNGHPLLVQSRQHPDSGEIKRAFPDEAYQQAGAGITEDLSTAQLIFGLKEIEIRHILPEKAYLIFSHTHKGQVKNRQMLKTFMEQGNTVIDYELIVNDHNARLITAFTYFAGYAGMVDSLWTLGKRLKGKGIAHPFQRIPQSIEKEDLDLIKSMIRDCGQEIIEKGTPAELPPMIMVVLGNGKTSYGAQEVFHQLPVKELESIDELADVFANGSRHQVYKLVLDVPQMFRLKADSKWSKLNLSDADLFEGYLNEPDQFESNLDLVLPYTTMLMNCIIWSPKFPRLMSRDQTEVWYRQHQTLEVIGDITCDPEGAIHFSKETWIDDPVFVYNPFTRVQSDGFAGEGIAVMAVTNLPCEFSADASAQFSENLSPMLTELAAADFAAASPEAAGLPKAIQRAVILWQGKFTEPYQYMQDYVPEA
ncbi:MAG: hypothetical protein AAF206_17385 [Bacteroidota bacterium]